MKDRRVTKEQKKICPLHHTEKDTTKIKISFLDSVDSRNPLSGQAFVTVASNKCLQHETAVDTVSETGKAVSKKKPCPEKK